MESSIKQAAFILVLHSFRLYLCPSKNKELNQQETSPNNHLYSINISRISSSVNVAEAFSSESIISEMSALFFS